jgi:hypothetical protein
MFPTVAAVQQALFFDRDKAVELFQQRTQARGSI